jgi:carbamate kinase
VTEPARVRAVVSYGGNAFATRGEELTMAAQFRYAREALSHLRQLAQSELVLSHGNGPQVGHILIRVEEALGKAYRIPLEVCVAESEGELGYVIEQTLHNLMVDWECPRPIASLLTQVVVREDDPAFQHPDKPIGPHYDDARGAELARAGFVLREDAGRGLRRVVPSPRPIEIVQIEVVRRLLALGVVVVAAGGGGIPVVRTGGKLCGIEAVVDKDHASSLLARELDANLLVLVTGVPCAYRCFGGPEQEPIGLLDVGRARGLVDEGHFAPGSMLPKMQACIEFAAEPSRRAIICDAASVDAALAGRAGTIVEAR